MQNIFAIINLYAIESIATAESMQNNVNDCSYCQKLARNCSHQNANVQCCTQLQGTAQPTKDKNVGPPTAGTNAASTMAESAIAKEK